MNLAQGCAMDLQDMFIDFPTKKLTIYGKSNNKHHKQLAAQIFKDCFKLVMQDIINDSIAFVLPNIGRVTGCLYCKTYKDDDFVFMYKNGFWKDLDFLSTLFKGALPVVELSNNYGQKRYKTVFIDKKLKEQLIDNLNKGFKYLY